jgi:hypothetical protein
MLFKPELCKAILRGNKTETRRIAKPGESSVMADGRIEMVLHWRYGVGEAQEVVKWRVGQTYSIQPGRGKPGIGPRIKLRAIRRERLADITAGGAKREGFPSRYAFFEMWDKLNPEGPGNPEVWVLSFKLV